MQMMIGCAGIIAVAGFVFGLVVSLLVSETTWTEHLMSASMIAGITFAAALLLLRRDSARFTAAIRIVRADLLARDDVSSEDFTGLFPTAEPALLIETREAIARFFDVPTGKINRDVHLIHDLRVDKFEPSFQFSVVNAVIASQAVVPKPFPFTMAGLESIDDLTDAICKVLDTFDNP